MVTLLNAAKHLARDRGLALEADDDPAFDAPLVPAGQRDVFDALHLLHCAATGQDPSLINVSRVAEWLDYKAKGGDA